MGRTRPRLTLANIQELQRYDWPGNVRELQHSLERACVVAVDGKLRFDLPVASLWQRARPIETAAPTRILTESDQRAIEINNIRNALSQTRGKIYGTDGAAALLQIKPTTLNSRIKALGLTQTDRQP